MFEQSFVETRVRTNRGWTVVASFASQFVVVCVALLVPLLKPELLPRVFQSAVFLGPPPAAVPRPPDVPRAAQPSKAPPPLMTAAGLRLTGRIPEKPASIVDPPDVEIGVNGSPGPAADSASRSGVPSGLWKIQPTAAPPPQESRVQNEPTAAAVVRVQRGGDVQEAMLIHRVIPLYPPLAKTTRTQGTVIFTAVIGRDGIISNLQLVSGHALLVGAASEAVKQWRYRPTSLNGKAVEVLTTIQVTFTLTQ